MPPPSRLSCAGAWPNQVAHCSLLVTAWAPSYIRTCAARERPPGAAAPQVTAWPPSQQAPQSCIQQALGRGRQLLRMQCAKAGHGRHPVNGSLKAILQRQCRGDRRQFTRQVAEGQGCQRRWESQIVQDRSFTLKGTVHPPATHSLQQILKAHTPQQAQQVGIRRAHQLPLRAQRARAAAAGRNTIAAGCAAAICARVAQLLPQRAARGGQRSLRNKHGPR